MNEEINRLIARIQHFYDLMGQQREKLETDMVGLDDAYLRTHTKILADVLGGLESEYQKVFGNILYQE